MFFAVCLIPPLSLVGFRLGEYGIPYFTYIFTVGGACFIWVCGWIKKKLVEASPADLRIVQADLNEFPGMDTHEFARYTSELEALGFVWQADYKIQTTKQGFPTGGARVMLHRDHKCFAEINQINNKGAWTPVRCVLMSYSLSDTNGRRAIRWMLSTTNRTMTSAGYAIRHSWSYGDSVPDAGPAQLLEHHRSRRAQIVNETEMNVSEDISAETFFILLQQSIIDRRQLIKNKNILAMLFQIDLFDFSPKSSWAGKPAKT